MKDRKIILFLTIGFLLLIAGFFIGRSSNKTQSALEKSITPSVISSTTQNEKGSVSAKEEVKVTKVFDGDTVQTETGEKIRYIGINTPETGQPFSSEATAANKLLALGKNVRLEFDVQTKDRYGRTLAYVFADDTFVNLEMVKKGLAVPQTIQPNVRYQKEILKAQKEARDNCLGMWAKLCKDEKLKPAL